MLAGTAGSSADWSSPTSWRSRRRWRSPTHDLLPRARITAASTPMSAHVGQGTMLTIRSAVRATGAPSVASRPTVRCVPERRLPRTPSAVAPDPAPDPSAAGDAAGVTAAAATARAAGPAAARRPAVAPALDRLRVLRDRVPVAERVDPVAPLAVLAAAAALAVDAAVAGAAAGCDGWDDFLLDFPFAPLFPLAP